MSKIDVSQWKEFNIGKLFDFYRGKEVAPNRVPDGAIPFISETRANNGMVKLASSEHIFSGKSITVSVNYASTVLYQEKDFCASVNIIVLHNDKLTVNAGLFLVAVISKLHQKYSYNDKVSAFKLKQENIKLPVDSLGNPDWQYMDEYIAKLATQAHTNISLLRQQQRKAPTFNIDRWKEFSLSHLFHAEFTDGDNKIKELTESSNGLNLIGPLLNNNGILGKFISKTKVFDANTITWDMFGNAYLQREKYQTVSHGHVLVLSSNQSITANAKLFICALLTKLGHQKQFGYTNMLTLNKFNHLSIKLPATATGQPDWQYMDNYISSILQAQKERVARLTSIVKK